MAALAPWHARVVEEESRVALVCGPSPSLDGLCLAVDRLYFLLQGEAL